jgi:N-acetylglucosamine repressor
LIANLRGKLVESFRTEAPTGQDPRDCMDAVIAEVRAMLARWQGPQGRLLGIGLGIPGLIDSVKGTVLFSPNLGWENIPAQAIWHDALGLPVFVEIDVDALALGEQWFGLGRQSRSLACLHFGAGVGCGVVVDGKIYRGASGGGGEVGHTVIDPDGPPCRCGNQGCLETFAGGQAIATRVMQGLVSAVPSSLHELTSDDPRQLTLPMIFAAARQGDRLAQTAIAQTIKYTGMTVANVINSFDPEVVILSGDLIDEGADLTLDGIVETARLHVFGRAARLQTPILVTKLGKRVSALGPACLVFQNQFADLFEMAL